MATPDTCPSCSERVPPGSRFCQTCGSEMKARRPSPVKSPVPKRSNRVSQPFVFAAGALVIILLTGLVIGGMTWARSREKHVAQSNATSPATTVIEGAGPMPAWLVAADASIIADYSWASEHHDELKYFPCFCGCYDSVGHVSNSDCYYKRGNENRILAFDQHAYG